MKNAITILIASLTAFVFTFAVVYLFAIGHLDVFVTLCMIALTWLVSCIIALETDEQRTKRMNQHRWEYINEKR